MNAIDYFGIGDGRFSALDMCKIFGAVTSREYSLNEPYVDMDKLELHHEEHRNKLTIDCHINNKPISGHFQKRFHNAGEEATLGIAQGANKVCYCILRPACHGVSLLCLPMLSFDYRIALTNFDSAFLQILVDSIEMIEPFGPRRTWRSSYDGERLTLDRTLHVPTT